MEKKYKNTQSLSSTLRAPRSTYGAQKKGGFYDKTGRYLATQPRSRVLSLTQLLSRVRKQRGGLFQQKSSNLQKVIGSRDSNTQNRFSQFGKQGPNYQINKNSFSSLSSGNKTKGLTRIERDEQKRQKPIKPIIPPKSFVTILKKEPDKILYNRRIIDYKHCGLLQRYIGLGGKILPRRQTRLTAKQQRYIAKTIKSARIMGLLPFVSKEKGFFR